MNSLETLIRDLFFRAKIWPRIVWASILCYFLLGFGYLRLLVQHNNASPSPELPPLKFTKTLVKKTFIAFPLGTFYFLTPLFLAWGVENILRLCQLLPLVSIVWGAGSIFSITLTSVALVIVQDDPERFFLGLEFEEVLSQWWKLKRVWALPALMCYGFIAALGWLFYGFTFFVSVAFLISILGVAVRNSRYA